MNPLKAIGGGIKRAAGRARDKAKSIANRISNRIRGTSNVGLPSPNMVGGGH